MKGPAVAQKASFCTIRVVALPRIYGQVGIGPVARKEKSSCLQTNSLQRQAVDNNSDAAGPLR